MIHYICRQFGLVRAGYGFNNIAVYELKDDEKLSDLIKFAGGHLCSQIC